MQETVAKAQQDFYERFWDEWEPRDAVEGLMHKRRLELLKSLIPEDTQRIMFLGCGYGEELAISAHPAFGLDLSLHGLLRARQRWQGIPHEFIQGDATELPFRSNYFDCIVCAGVFEHILKKKEMLLECKRILRSNGVLILDVPNWYSFFGLCRKAYEIVSGRRYLTEDQDVDDWFTPGTLAKTIAPYLSVVSRYGTWFFPPTGLRRFRIPARVIYPIFKFLLPLDRLFSRTLPSFGQLLTIVCKKVS